MIDANRKILHRLCREHFDNRPHTVWRLGLGPTKFNGRTYDMPHTTFLRIFREDVVGTPEQWDMVMGGLAQACLSRGVIIEELYEYYDRDDLRLHAARAFSGATDGAFSIIFKDTKDTKVGSFKITRDLDNEVLLELEDWKVKQVAGRDTDDATVALEEGPATP